MIQLFKKATTGAFDWLLYTALSEKQKEKLANLFSDKQKENIKRMTKYGKKHNQKLQVKKLKDHLYTLGFRKRALQQFIDMLETESDPYMRRLVAWELTLYFANHYTKEGAEEALSYIQIAENGEKDIHQLRRIAIIKAECLEAVDQTEEAKDVLQQMLHQQDHSDLYLAFANLEKDISTRLEWINKVYEQYQLHPITFKNVKQADYDDLMVEKKATAIGGGPKVSIILPAYNAEEGIQVAIESILGQTWQNLELLIVDDCSPDQTKKVAEQYAEKDARIKVLSTPVNSGPYTARNIALQHATGEYVTVNDADDWSHEKKIEIQATHLQEHPTVIANTSSHARLTEDLLLYRRGTPGRYLFPNMSSIMFRREAIKQKLGYWDSVRFAADGEFKRRLLRTFGKDSYVDLETGPLSLPRQSVTSLTGSSAFGYNGFFMGVRKEYVESLEHYHETHEDLYFPYPMKERLFPVPEPMWPRRAEKQDGMRHMTYVIAADFREPYATQAAFQKQLQELIQGETGAQIGLMQVYHYQTDAPLKVADEIREFMDESNVQMLVYGEKITTEKLMIMNYNGLEEQQMYIPYVQANQIDVHMQKDISYTNETIEQKLSLLFGDNITCPLASGILSNKLHVFNQDDSPLLGDWELEHEK